jgi:hypothetical protein
VQQVYQSGNNEQEAEDDREYQLSVIYFAHRPE